MLYLIRFQLVIPTNILEIYTGILFIWWLVRVIRSAHSARATHHKPNPKDSGLWADLLKNKRTLIAATLFLISTTIALIATLTKLPSEFITVPLGIWKGWFIAPALMFFMIITTFKTKEDLKLLTDIFVYSAGIYAILACFEYFTDLLPGPARTYDNRLVWPYYDPLTLEGSSGNYPALFLGPALILAFQKILKYIRSHLSSPFNPWTISIFTSMIFMAFAIFLTKSFAAWLAIIITITLSIFLQIQSRKKWIIPIIGALVIGIVGLSQIGTEKFQYALKAEGDSSTAERIRIYTVSLGIIQADPVFGAGMGQFQRQFELQAPEILGKEITRKEINHALHSHNLFLMMYTSLGILGFLTFLYFLYVLLTKNPYHLALTLTMPLVYILIHGLFDVPYFKNDLAYEFWFLASLITIGKHIPLSVRVNVVKGMGLATKFGFPTVNLELPKDTPLLYGVYRASLTGKDGKQIGVLGYGKRFTQDINEETCEIHLFDSEGFTEDTGELHVTTKIRRWKKFKNIDKLKNAVKQDINKAKQ